MGLAGRSCLEIQDCLWGGPVLQARLQASQEMGASPQAVHLAACRVPSSGMALRSWHTQTEHSLCVGHHSRCLRCVNRVRKVLLLILRWRNWSTEGESNLLKVTQLLSGRSSWDLEPHSQAPGSKFYSGPPMLPSMHNLEAFLFSSSTSLQSHLHLSRLPL